MKTLNVTCENEPGNGVLGTHSEANNFGRHLEALGRQKWLLIVASMFGLLALASSAFAQSNTVTGTEALKDNTTGTSNTADGYLSLYENTSGGNNTAVGAYAGVTIDGTNITGFSNTFLGYGTAIKTGTLSNTAAIGVLTEVDQSNSIVLGSIAGVNGATVNQSVGIGTTKPAYRLHVGATNKAFRVDGPASGTKNPILASFGGNGDFGIDGPGCVQCRFVVKDTTGFVGIGTPAPSHPLQMADGSYEDHGFFSNSSDRNLKAGFAPVDGADLLVRLNAVPMSKWRYKSEPESIRHIGPMAQDFYTAFGLGSDDKHIGTIDEGGVALAAIQELYRMVLSKDKELHNLKLLTHEKDEHIKKLAAEVERLENLDQAVQILSTRLKKVEAAGKQEVLRASN